MPKDLPQYVRQASIPSLRQVQFSNAQAETTRAVSEEFERMSESMHQKGLEIEKVRATTQMKLDLDEMFSKRDENNQLIYDTPEKLKNAQESYLKGFEQEFGGSEQLERFKADYQLLARNYLNKRTAIFMDNQDVELKGRHTADMEAEIASAEAIAEGIVSEVPEFQQDSAKALGKKATKLDQLKAAKKHDGSSLYTAAEIAAFEKRQNAATRKKAKRLHVKPLEDGLFSENPERLIREIELAKKGQGKLAGKGYDNKTLEKYQKDAVKRFEDLQDRTRILNVLDASAKNTALWQSFQAGDVDILDKVEDFVEAGGDPTLAEFIREQQIKADPITQEEQDNQYLGFVDRVIGLEMRTVDGKVKVRKDATLEDIARLQIEMQRASVRGIEGLEPLIRKVAPALVAKANKERGKDDIGEVDALFGFIPFNVEAYDVGYEVINNRLKALGKEGDAGLRAILQRNFIKKVDDLDEDTKKNQQLFEQEMERISRSVEVKGVVEAAKDNKEKKQPYESHIKHLLENPELAPKFDELWGIGAAAEILGQ